MVFHQTRFIACCYKTKLGLGKLLSGDWVFLALLGIVMAFCSFGMDYCIEKIQESKYHFASYITGPMVNGLSFYSPYLALRGFQPSRCSVHYLDQFHDDTRLVLCRILPYDRPASYRYEQSIESV
jgi:hypothetical protein